MILNLDRDTIEILNTIENYNDLPETLLKPTLNSKTKIIHVLDNSHLIAIDDIDKYEIVLKGKRELLNYHFKYTIPVSKNAFAIDPKAFSHSNNPNCHISIACEIVASRDIKPGEELTVNYVDLAMALKKTVRH